MKNIDDNIPVVQVVVNSGRLRQGDAGGGEVRRGMYIAIESADAIFPQLQVVQTIARAEEVDL